MKNVCGKVSDAAIDSDSGKERHLPAAMEWSIILFVLILIVLTPNLDATPIGWVAHMSDTVRKMQLSHF